MAGSGRLPGVGLSQRKRSSASEHIHHRSEHLHHGTYRSFYLRDESLEESSPWMSDTALDEGTLKARLRLQKKLGHFFHSISSESENLKKDGTVREITFQKRDAWIGRKLLPSSWLLLPNKFRKERKVCAICLEDFQQEESNVMNLSCSHKYHSECLIPWLAAHPHCPYCRTPVEH